MIRKILVLFLFLLASSSISEGAKFDWGTIVEMPPGAEQTGGSQVLHFKSVNKPWWQSEYGMRFVAQYLEQATPLASDAEVLKFASDQVTLEGLFIELGVCTGKTINFIAALNPHKKIYGFDSFLGLPEDWDKGDKKIHAGVFAFKNPDVLPPVLHNVKLIKGMFYDTLPRFHQTHDPKIPIALLHVDSDIYSSASQAFESLGDRIMPGTVIVFDELYNYPGYEHHEFRALQELLQKRNLHARYIAYNMYHEQVAVLITNNE